ncbi:cytochrome P450 [Tropicimonas sp. IMCC6043]|uniref:cytochrome P450 n=1 Tax=Tropicimonas sp. IMCC6043 TaxID=2510645 RepID=UPI00101BBDC3|nr:cytochrome P450 [Tropicimonas sp. IMCC6043]RYH09185.1 cytochrome P450 [Tropicimonas sp. IMCC6043]
MDERILELPRITLVSTRLGPPLEMARWLLERRRIPYEEQAHAPIFHAFVSRRHGVGIELPLVRTPEGPWVGLKGFLHGLDAKCRPGEKVLGETDAERERAENWIALFYDKLFWPAVQVYYHFMLDHRETVTRYALDRAPDWQKFLVRTGFGTWQKAMRKGIGLKDFDLDAALGSIGAVFDAVEAESGETGFLGGATPSDLDVIFAALAGPMLLPTDFPAPLPSVEELPEDYREIVIRFRDRRAGILALETYRLARPEPQPPMTRLRSRGSLANRLTESRPALWAARWLAARRSTISLRGTVLAVNWQSVTEMLERDSDFIIAPVNAPRIEGVSGPFILSMDRGDPDLFPQREAVYASLRQAGPGAARDILDREASALLEAARERHGRIDVINGYARLVAARTAAEIFGISGPTEADLVRVIRAVFHETFLNLGDDPEVQARGRAAGEELADWFAAEIARRGEDAGSDVLGGLIRAQRELPLEPQAVVWMAAGLIVGAIDTTATSVANAARVILERPKVLRAVRRDLDDPAAMTRWCKEALRQRPHNPIVLRRTRHATRLAGRDIAPGTTVIATTLAAMQDASVFPRPGRLLPQREASRYLHYGHGLHVCAGRDINDVQIPALVAHLLRAGADKVVSTAARGPFPDELVVRLGETP